MSTTAAYCLRRVDRDRQNPIDITGDPHTDGEIWSRVLWDLRQTLGASTADTLALESNFYLPPAATLEDAGKALLDADAKCTDRSRRADNSPGVDGTWIGSIARAPAHWSGRR